MISGLCSGIVFREDVYSFRSGTFFDLDIDRFARLSWVTRQTLEIASIIFHALSSI